MIGRRLFERGCATESGRILLIEAGDEDHRALRERLRAERLGRAVMAATGSQVTAGELPADLRLPRSGQGVQIPGWTMDQLERHAILETLKAAGGSTTRAACILGISVRNVQYKLRAYRAGAPATDLRARPEGGEKVA